MEFLDPKKRRAHLIRLAIGYILIGIALVLTTIILLYQAYGFGLKNGEVIQNGLVFVSSNPSGADIFVNGQKREEQTNVRLLMPGGQYTFELKRSGYQSWKRAITIEGGKVVRFDYPMLFPSKPETKATKRYDLRPTIMTQSPNRRWVFVQANQSFREFDVFDLSKPDKAPVTVTLPESISSLTGAHSWKLVEWANDNAHVLLQHIVDKDGKQTSEYILVNRESPSESVNLTSTLGVNPTKIELRDKKYDKYFLYTQSDRKLMTATLAEPQPQTFLEDVLAFKSHGEDVMLYATDKDASEGKVALRVRDGETTQGIREVLPAEKYLLEIAKYEGDWYVVGGSPTENRTYAYKNPVQVARAKPELPLVPIQVLKTVNPTAVSFSDNARFIAVQGGQQFSVYDAETDKGYAYMVSNPVDTPQDRAVWMDGHRLMYVSSGKTFVFDFDDTNEVTLTAADSTYRPVFDPEYRALYTVAPQPSKGANGESITQFILYATQLRTVQDR